MRPSTCCRSAQQKAFCAPGCTARRIVAAAAAAAGAAAAAVVQLAAHLHVPSVNVVPHDWLGQSPDLYAACACRLQAQAGNKTAWRRSGAALMRGYRFSIADLCIILCRQYVSLSGFRRRTSVPRLMSYLWQDFDPSRPHSYDQHIQPTRYDIRFQTLCAVRPTLPTTIFCCVNMVFVDTKSRLLPSSATSTCQPEC
jgi:hypothetical protein